MIFGQDQLEIYGQPIQEVYFGKDKDLEKMEWTLNEFRKEYLGEYGKMKNFNVNSNTLLQSFNRQVEKYFNLYGFSLHIINERTVNAFTCPIQNQFDVRIPKLADETTFKFKKEAKYVMSVCVYAGIVFNPQFTTEEVMAVIMHEIGHNFDAAINKPNAILSRIVVAANTVAIVLDAINGEFSGVGDALRYNQVSEKILYNVETRLRKNESGLIVLSDICDQLKSTARNIAGTLSDVFRVATFGLGLPIIVIGNVISYFSACLRNPAKLAIDKIYGGIGKRNEKVADNFCTIYGYGGSLSSALYKMEYTAADDASVVFKAVDNIPVYGTLIHTFEQPGLIVASVLDEHPASINRAKDQLALLKRDLAKEDLDPKMRKIMLEDVKECEKAIDNLTNTMDGIQDPYVVKKHYAAFLDNLGNKFNKRTDKEREKRFSSYDTAYDNRGGRRK